MVHFLKKPWVVLTLFIAIASVMAICTKAPAEKRKSSQIIMVDRLVNTLVCGTFNHKIMSEIERPEKSEYWCQTTSQPSCGCPFKDKRAQPKPGFWTYRMRPGGERVGEFFSR